MATGGTSVELGAAASNGQARIHLYPGEPGTGYVFENEIVGGAIPKEFIKPIENGIREALTHGVLAGYPVDDVRVKLYDGSYTALWVHQRVEDKGTSGRVAPDDLA
jgi:translation elongation factor EF-G